MMINVNKDYKDEKGWTGLMYCVEIGNIEMVKHFVSQGADIHCENNDKMNCLMLAASKNYLEIAEFFLQKGVDTEHKDTRDRTALLYATKCGHLEMIKLLEKYGADISYCSNSGESGFTLSAFNQHKDCLLYFTKNVIYKDNE